LQPLPAEGSSTRLSEVNGLFLLYGATLHGKPLASIYAPAALKVLRLMQLHGKPEAIDNEARKKKTRV
jgi:hypothetical protein